MGAACEGSTQDSQDKASVWELGTSSFQGKFGLHSQTQGWEGALSEGLHLDIGRSHQGIAEGATETSWSGFCGSC